VQKIHVNVLIRLSKPVISAYLLGAEEECNADPCLEWEWGEWGACSGTCSTGTAPTRTRSATGCCCTVLPNGDPCTNVGCTANLDDCSANTGRVFRKFIYFLTLFTIQIKRKRYWAQMFLKFIN